MKFRIMMVAMVLLLLTGIAFGKEEAVTTIDGKWTGNYSTGFGEPMKMEYTFKAEGDVLTGSTLGGANGEQIPISEGKIDGNKISFVVLVSMQGQQMRFSYTGELAGEKLKLKFTTGGQMGSTGAFTVTRAKEKATKEKKKK